MTKFIGIGNRTITETEIISLLAGYRMLPQLWRELIIDSTIASIELSPQQEKKAVEQFETLHHLTTLALRQAWLEHYGMTLNQLKTLAIRELKIETFKQLSWGHRLESYFLTDKSKLDKVIYSLLRVTQAEGLCCKKILRTEFSGKVVGLYAATPKI